MSTPNPDDYFGSPKGEATAKPKKGKRSTNPDDYFGPVAAPAPPAEKKPGLIKRGLAAVSSLMTDPSHAAAADGQRLPPTTPSEPGQPTDWRGVDEVDAGGGTFDTLSDGQAPAPTGEAGAGRGLVNPELAGGGRRGGTPAALRGGAYVAGTVEPPPRPTAGELLETPRADFQPSQADLEWQSLSPAKQQEILALKARRGSPGAFASEPGVAETIGANVREFTKNPVARGAVAGFSQLGQTGIGAVRGIADAVGADSVADFAAGASGKATQIGDGATRDLKGNDKLAADIFSSILNSAPSLAVGMAGGAPLRTLFAQSALAAYNSGRDAGFSPMESASRAGIMGLAEALGERFGLPQQIALLKSVAKHVPTGELARTFGEMISREIPGEQLTTAMQFLADKLGPAALNPDASLADYLSQAGETLKVTIGQTAVMGGGPAAIGTVRNAYRKVNDAAATPEQLLARALDEASAQYGLNTKAAAKLREKIAGMDPDTATNYAEKVFAAAERAGLVKKPGGGTAVRQNLKDLADKAAKDAEAQRGNVSGDSVPAGAAASSDTGLADDMDAGSILGTTGQPAAAQPEAAGNEGAADGVAQDETAAQSGVPGSAAPPIEGEKINKAWSAFTPESGTLNIPREQMPQVDAEHRGALVNFLNARGITHESAEVPSASLKPTQAEFSPKKVEHFASNPSGRSILVSQDGYVLDGHHQWMAKRAAGEPVKVIRLAAPIQDLLRLAHQFPSSTTAKGPTNAVSGTGPRPDAGRTAEPGSADGGATGGTVDLVQGEQQQPAPAGVAGGAVPGSDAGGVPGATGPGDGNEALKPGRVGAKLAAGEVVLTASGRKTTPFPKLSFDTNRKATNTLRAVDQWLIQNALDEARSRGDNFNAGQFEQALKAKSPSQSDKDSAEEYLFGDQPAVVPSILRPLVPAALPTLTAGQSVTIDGVPYTVKSAKPKSLVLTDATGKPRTVTSDSATWAKVKPAGARSIGKDQPDVVQGSAPVAQAKPNQEAAAAGGVEPAGTPAAPAVPAARTAPVEADGVKPAGPVIQNRDRSTPAAITQMRGIAASPDYLRLSASRDFTAGAPVIVGDIPLAQLGRKETMAAGKRRIYGVYAVVEAAELVASHSVDGSANPAFEKASTKVIAGNGRTAGLQEAYRAGNANDYRAELEDDGSHGINPEIIRGMKAPVLVRVMPASEVTDDIGDISNTQGGLQLSAVEQARNDANRVDLDALEFTEDGRITPDTVRRFVQAMPQSEQGNLIDRDGSPTAQAVDRLNAVVFFKAYNSEPLTNLYAQAADPDARNIMSALAQAATSMARLEGAGALDIRPLIAEAAEIAINGRRNGLKLSEIAAQDRLDADPDTRVILNLFASNATKVKPVAEALKRAADFAYSEANKPADDMFGAVSQADRGDVVSQIGPRDEARGAQNLEEPAGGKPAGRNAQGRAPEGPGQGNAGAAEEGASAVQAEGLKAQAEKALKSGDLNEFLRLNRLLKAQQVEGLGDLSDGGVLRHEKGGRWAMVLPDVDGGGKWRIQRFDKRGFSGHSVFNTQGDAAEAAIQEGYTQREDDAINRLEGTPEFVRGNFVTELIGKVNAGTLTHDEADRLIAEYDAKGATGKDLFGARPEDVGSAKQDLEAKRKALVDLEDRIVSLAGLAPGFVEDALRSRKVPKALKDERDQLREDIRQMREQVAKLDMPVKDMEAYIKVAADSIADLRKTDVYRVLVESNRAALRQDIATYIKANRPDLAKEVDDVLAEQDAEAKPALSLAVESEADAQAKAEREAKALADEQKAKADEQARLKREADDKEARARADSSVDDFQLGQSADAQLSGQKDIFGGAAPEEVVPAPQSLPDSVKTMLRWGLGRLNDARDALAGVERARGHGHTLAVEWKEQQQAIKEGRNKLAEIRGLADKNGMRATVEDYIREQGGEPDIERFNAAPAPAPEPAKRAPKSFRQSHKVTTSVFMEDTGTFSQQEVDADTALTALAADIEALNALRNCIAGV